MSHDGFYCHRNRWRCPGGGTPGCFLYGGTGGLCGYHGESGSGKTTLLNILAGLDKPTGGRAEDMQGRLAPVAAGSVPGEGSVFYLDVKNIAPTMRAVVLRNELPDR